MRNEFDASSTAGSVVVVGVGPAGVAATEAPVLGFLAAGISA